MSTPEIGAWAQGLPTEPGIYLFYGDYCCDVGEDGMRRPNLAQFMICTARRVRDGGLVISAGGQFLYASEAIGVHAPFACEPPVIEPMEGSD